MYSVACVIAILLPVPIFSQAPGLYEILPKYDFDPSSKDPQNAKVFIALERVYYANGAKYTTDTLRIEVFDNQGRRIEYIDFENNKRSTHYFTVHEDDKHSLTYYYSKGIRKTPVKVVTQREYNDHHQEIEVINGMELDSSFVVNNAHVFRYNDQGRRVYECHRCQSDNPLQYAYNYLDTLMVSAYQFIADTAQKVELYEMEYNAFNQITRMLGHKNYANVLSFDQERTYTYEGKQLVEATERHYFEDGAVRRYQFKYDEKGRVMEKRASIDSLQMATSYTYRKNQLVRTTTISGFPMSTEITVWFSKKAKFYGPPKTTTLVTDYAYDRNGQLISKTHSADGVVMREYIYEYTYEE